MSGTALWNVTVSNFVRSKKKILIFHVSRSFFTKGLMFQSFKIKNACKKMKSKQNRKKKPKHKKTKQNFKLPKPLSSLLTPCLKWNSLVLSTGSAFHSVSIRTLPQSTLQRCLPLLVVIHNQNEWQITQQEFCLQISEISECILTPLICITLSPDPFACYKQAWTPWFNRLLSSPVHFPVH